MGLCFARTLTWQLFAIAFILIYVLTIYYMNSKCPIQVAISSDPEIPRDPVSFFPMSSQAMTYTAYQFNVLLSNRLPLKRDVPDTRPIECKSMYSEDREYDLPTVSVIIPFHNEAWSVLLRGLQSILNRSSSTLLKEVILVDDKSTLNFLQKTLEVYLKSLRDSRVVLIRKEKRDGLMTARMAGARQATGDVLVFLDAHVEVNVKWLEPLLEAIKKDRRRIAVPVIDNIEPSEMEYGKWGEFTQGGFRWNLDFQWKKIHRDSYTSTRRETDPFPTGTIIGCAMAVDREYFFQMGAYDEAMRIWGGENIEISFKTWMCGGSIYAYPCSRVGHLFRKYLPYSFPSKFGASSRKVIQKNLQRVAELWMDDYKKYYFATVPDIIPPTKEEFESLQERKALRNRLQCKDFSWYIHNIIPDMPLPKEDPQYHGQLMNAEDNYCLIQWTNSSKSKTFFSIDSCNPYFYNNSFSLTKDHRIVLHNDLCLNYNENTDNALDVVMCSEKLGKWTFNTSRTGLVRSILGTRFTLPMPLGQLQYSDNTVLCLTLTKRHNVDLVPCNIKDTNQFWYFSYSFRFKSHEQMAQMGRF